jgi:hypothetical protein
MNYIQNGANGNFNLLRGNCFLYKELIGFKTNPDMGYVYVLYNPKSKLVKIGKTKSPKSRFSTLSNQNGSTFKYFITEQIYIESLVEKVMHNKFSNKRKKGEWFDIGFDDAVLELKSLLESDDFKRRNILKFKTF